MGSRARRAVWSPLLHGGLYHHVATEAGAQAELESFSSGCFYVLWSRSGANREGNGNATSLGTSGRMTRQRGMSF